MECTDCGNEKTVVCQNCNPPEDNEIAALREQVKRLQAMVTAQARYMPLLEWDGVHSDTCQCRQCEYLRVSTAVDIHHDLD